MSDAYATASKLLTLGFSVMPSGGGEKHKAPLVNWKPYQSKPPTQAELQTWQATLNPLLWGLCTGAVSGIVVLDADTLELRIDLEAELRQPPHIITPRAGGHWYFKHPGYSVKTLARVLPGVDIRGDGGFINIIGKRLAYSDDGVLYPDAEYQVVTLPEPGNLLPWEKLPTRIKAVICGYGHKPAQKASTITDGTIPEGERNARLTSLAGSMRERNMPQSAIEAALLETNRTQCQPPLSEAEVRAIAASVSRYEPGQTKTASTATDNKPPKALVIRRMFDVVAEKVGWLWFPYLPIGKLTLLEGDPGVGKSWVSLAIATALSLGTALPGDARAYSCPLLVASAEDGIRDTIKPRLSAMGADTRNIYTIDGLFTLDDSGFEELEQAICETVPGLIIIDPLVAYLSGDMDINKANQARYATSRLAALADKYHAAVLAIRHLTKGSSQKAIYRGLGSVDFTAAARSVLMAGADPNDPTNTGLVHIKNNLAIKGEAIGYKLADGTFTWKTNCDLTAEKIMQASDNNSSSLDEAKEFLKERLAPGELVANDVFNEAKSRGLSSATIDRAKAKLKIVAYRRGEQGVRGGGKWYWKLPQKVD